MKLMLTSQKCTNPFCMVQFWAQAGWRHDHLGCWGQIFSFTYRAHKYTRVAYAWLLMYLYNLYFVYQPDVSIGDWSYCCVPIPSGPPTDPYFHILCQIPDLQLPYPATGRWPFNSFSLRIVLTEKKRQGRSSRLNGIRGDDNKLKSLVLGCGFYGCGCGTLLVPVVVSTTVIIVGLVLILDPYKSEILNSSYLRPSVQFIHPSSEAEAGSLQNHPVPLIVRWLWWLLVAANISARHMAQY